MQLVWQTLSNADHLAEIMDNFDDDVDTFDDDAKAFFKHYCRTMPQYFKTPGGWDENFILIAQTLAKTQKPPSQRSLTFKTIERRAAMAQDNQQQQIPLQVPSAHALALTDKDTHQPWYTTGWYTHLITGDNVSRDCIGEMQYMPYQYERCVASSHQQVHYFKFHDGAATWQAEPPLDQALTAAEDVQALLDFPMRFTSEYNIPNNLIDIPQIGEQSHEDWKNFIDLLYYLLHKEQMILNAALQGLRCVFMRRQLPTKDVDQNGSPFNQFESDFHAWFRSVSAPEPGAEYNWIYAYDD
ncbi:Altered inheritance of mitochondria protein 24, mitochondrial [Ascosphaera pollenicola]|nr:Altered inheritance of mitochondria protein 24, mitochondrial [Ascosphaera pollenicola]